MTCHCQICERPIKANTGLIAHHGYQRPGDGWQTASCPGARRLPYERSADAIPPYVECLRAVDAARAAEVERLAAPDATFQMRARRASAQKGRTVMVEMTPAVPLYAVRKAERVRALEGERRQLAAEIGRLERRHREWRAS